MTKKPNFAKFILGTVVLALLFVGTWAATSARLTNAKKSTALTATTAPALPLSMPAPTATPPFVSPLDVFELEGNIADDPALAQDDWATVNCPNTGTPPGSGGSSAVHTGVQVDGINQSIFTTGGSKDTLDITGWKWKNGSVPPKDEILNVYAAKYTSGDDNILVFGAERIVTNGSAFIGVWFFQDEVSLNANGNFNGAHQVGDVLVLNEFSGGGAVANAKVFQWVTSAAQCSLPGEFLENTNLCDITGTAPLGSVLSTTNQTNEIPATEYCWPYTSGSGSTTMPVQSFFEGGINLDAFPALAGACFSSFLIETRSSFSTGSQLKDFALADFNTCPDPDITKTADDNDICAGDVTTYTYVASNPAGTSPAQVSLVDDNATPADLTDDFDPANSTTSPNCQEIVGGVGQPGPGSPFSVAGGASRTFRCTVTLAPRTDPYENTVTLSFQSGTETVTKTATASVTVHAVPDARISVVICADGSTLLTASDANDAGAPGANFTWTGAGGASTTGTTRTITGVGAYTVTIDNGFCSDSATRTISLCSDSIDAPTP